MEQPAQTSNDRTNRRKLVWGLVCLIGPTALIIVALLGYAVANFVFSTGAGPSISDCPTVDGIVQGANCMPEDTLFNEEPSPIKTILNIVLFLVGVISILTWLPGIIVGIILLATRKPLDSSHKSQ